MNEILELTKEILADEKTARSTLRKIRKTQKEILSALAEAQEEYSNIKRNDFLEDDIEQKIASLKNTAKELYADAVKDAVSSAPEFAFSAYVTGLLSIMQDENWITIKRSARSGFATSVFVSLNMNAVAGSTTDWAAGVEAVRDDLEIRGKDHDARSTAWAINIYSTAGSANGPYTKTILARIAASGKPAAFWELLDKGNVKVGLSSDIGGSAYPKNRATRFVSRVEREIKNDFRDWLKNKKIAFDTYRERVENSITSLRDSYDELSFVLTEIETKFDAIKSIAARYDRMYTDIDPGKVISAMDSAGATYYKVDVARKGAKRLRTDSKYFFRS